MPSPRFTSLSPQPRRRRPRPLQVGPTIHSPLTVTVNQRKLRWKREWLRLLRLGSNPATVELASMVRLMDETLSQCCLLLETRPGHRWLNAHRPSFGRLCKCVGCALSPLLTYFASGQLALEVVLNDAPPVPAKQHAMLTARWHFLAQREIQSLCGSCRHICAPTLVIAREPLGEIEPRSER